MKGKTNTTGNAGATAKRAGKPGITKIGANINEFTSRAAVGGTSAVGNFVLALDETGNPYTASQQAKYGLTAVAINLENYFGSSLFRAYDYYRVVDVETTITWTTTPTAGVAIAGEMLWVYDNDSRGAVPLETVANRTQLQSRMFTNNTLRHVLKWHPYLVEDTSTIGAVGGQLDYVQPRSRWLNTDNYANHRFGTIRLIGVNFSAFNGYVSIDATLEIRHRVKIETKGARSIQPPSNFAKNMKKDTPTGRITVASQM